MVAKDFIIPREVQFDPSSNDRYARIVIEPFERGYGITIGNSLRRVLLASLEGSAITAIRIEGIYHEFSALPGFQEDVTDLVLNLKRCQIALTQGDSLIFTFEHKGENVIYARDLFKDQPVEVYNPEHVIAVPARSDAKLTMELKVSKGRGYVPAEELELGHAERGTIYLDANFSPITKVNFHVEDARVGQRTDYDRLILEVWTNGSITPAKAVEYASSLLIEHLKIFVSSEAYTTEAVQEEEEVKEDENLMRLLRKPIEQVDFPQRAINCFKRIGLETVGDVVAKTELDLVKLPNMGQTTIKQVKEVLDRLGLQLGMKVSKPTPTKSARKPIEFHEPGVQTSTADEDEDEFVEKMLELDENE